MKGMRILKGSTGLASQYPSRRLFSSKGPPLDREAYLATATAHVQPGRSRAIIDYMSPTPSHLLNTSLAGIIPPEVHHPESFRNTLHNPDIATLDHHLPARREPAARLPTGHHLVYFGPQARHGTLLPDGTEAHTAPGAPFTRRMWAGGRVRFARPKPGCSTTDLRLNGSRAVCVEKVAREPVLKGTEGNEKVFVEMSRKYGTLDADSEGRSMAESIAEVEHSPAIDETRTLVFMRERDDPDLAEAAATTPPPTAAQSSVVKVRAEQRDLTRLRRLKDKNLIPTYHFSIVPDRTLLFQFSALTFNAHGIHLDRRYAQEVEGHKDLLVHGPLSLALMLMAVRAQADRVVSGVGKEGGEGKAVELEELNYRNLAPLYVDEEMKVCVRMREGASPGAGGHEGEETWDVWVEGPDGRFAVKGTATMRAVTTA